MWTSIPGGVKMGMSTPSSHSPWRWKPQCKPKCWNLFNIQQGLHLERKSYAITYRPQKPKTKKSLLSWKC
jgi:hypothetical protein